MELEYTAGALRWLNMQIDYVLRIMHGHPSFQPNAYYVPVPQVLQRARWDEERDAWALASPAASAPQDGPALHARRPSATPGALRPICAWARAAAASGAPRFLAENVLALERDVPGGPALRFGDAGAQVRACC